MRPLRRAVWHARAVIRIDPARDSDLAAVRALFAEYAASLGFSLAYQDFEAELASLPGAYAPPTGGLLVARDDDRVVGTVALRRLDGERCEMKRLYVRAEMRALRLGRALATAIVEHARSLGYRAIRLDTIATMTTAIALYRSMGFVEIQAYYPTAPPGTVFLELAL